jgi:DNA-binding response OmpR family regulator
LKLKVTQGVAGMDNKILLIDRQAQRANLVLSALQGAGISAIPVEDEAQALTLWASYIPDVIVIGEGSGLNGPALTRRLREEIVTPIILLSDRADEASLLSAYAAGVDDCLIWPVSPRVVAAKVKAWLRWARMMPFNALVRLSGQGLTLDPHTRAVHLPDGREVHLTSLEFRLLYHLMVHRGQPVSTDTLLNQVWGYESGDGALLKRLIYRLRQKIEPDPAQPRYIRTVPRIGYAFGQE